MITYRLSARSAGLRQTKALRLPLWLAIFAIFGPSACRAPSGNDSVREIAGRDSGASTSSDASKDRPDSKSSDVGVTKVCKADAGPPSKSKGETCACDGECRTGYCADGVCCSSACDEKCKACNLPSALGECRFIPAGVPPTNPSECGTATPATCGQDGTCDGKGGCQLYVADTVCNYGTCDGDGLGGVKTCDGKGNCGGNSSRTCAPYSCDSKTDECAFVCTTAAQCSLGQQCSSGSCGVKLNGYKCNGDGECASGHCSGGTCCNVACSGACVSCTLPGSVGRCQLVPAGQRSAGCSEASESTCGRTGYCDGVGACALWPAETTPCATSSCAGSTLLNATAVCDGRGTCQAAQLIDCAPFRCVAGACNTSCKSDADCEEGHACEFENGSTVGSCGKKQNGQPCGSDSDCNSGQCVDGVCCESWCEGPCRSCALPGSPGQCTNLPSGASDPRETCSDHGSDTCGEDGFCDGNGGCRVYQLGTKCGTASCDQGSFTDAPACNQTGQCVAPPSRSCSPYVCNGNVCFSSCSRDSDCVPPNTCVNHSCGKKQLGADCSSEIECESGFCEQGICCNAACTDACKACNLVGTLGFCTAVPDGTPDPQEKCQATEKQSCGTTGACRAGACDYVEKGTICISAACAGSSSQTPASTCDGRGKCMTPADVSCGTFLCSNNSCLSTCKSDSDCVSPNTCVNNSCGRKPNGATCTGGTQCASGFCTEGVCCNSACSDGTSGSLCMSCKVTGAVGTCTAVPSGQSDPKQRCVASKASSGDCSNDGTCNGKGACRPWSTSTGCRQATCSGSTFTPAANCDGNGSCSTVYPWKCDPYKCNSTSPSCLWTCTSSNDCVSGETCLQTNNRCGTTLANGQPCKAGSDCASGNCVGGACCSANSCFIDGACRADGATNPNNACQQCTPATSTTAWSPKENGTTCNDGNACTQTDTCQAGKCTGSNPVVCKAQDQCHNAGTCDPSTGCSNPAKENGAECDDGNVCTQTDTCQAGKCTGSNPVVCKAQDQCHNAGTCNSSTGCSNPAKSNGTSCDDGSKCTTNDTCQSGACTGGAAVVCRAQDQCHNAGTCDPSTGCSNPAKDNGATCDDGDKCTDNDTCQSGTCTAGSAVTCRAQDQCHTAGTCSPSTGCSNPAKDNGTTCDDGSKCTEGDTCQSGTCTGGTAVTCRAQDQCHNAGTCNPSTGCSNPAKDDGTTCNDGSQCTENDTCRSGVCMAGTAVTCRAQDQCHNAGTCDPGTGCSNPAKDDGAHCDDGNRCTENDTCQSGICTAGAGVTCTAQDQCHNPGTCDPSTGCSNPAKTNGTTCDDGSRCTENETCQSGACAGGTAVTCQAQDQCHLAGTCDPSSGCPNPAKANGDPCDDGNPCTQTDTCEAGMCTGSNPQPDGTPCGNHFACSSGRCPTSCSTNDDCDAAAGYTCNVATGVCGLPISGALP
jgi:hypothetical protein